MKTIKTIFTVLTLTLFTSIALSHEGHDHDAPKGVTPQKGGIIKSLEQSYVEVVSRGQNVKIYFFNKELKQQDASTYTVKAKAKKPRSKQAEVVTLKSGTEFLEANYDAKGVHRYTLELDIKDPKESHSDTIDFVVEPRK